LILQMNREGDERMAQREPSAAQALYPHLQSDARPERQQRGQSLAASMYQAQTPEAKAAQEWRERDRASLLRNLRVLNQRIQRLQRERGH